MGFDRRSFLKGTLGLGAAGAAGFPHIWIKSADMAYAAGGEIKVGVLYSLTGTTAIIETLAEPCDADGNRRDQRRRRRARQEAGAGGRGSRNPIRPRSRRRHASWCSATSCVSVFGSYTSASRKAVLPVFEKYKNLYWYPTLYEGRECSQNVIYTGAVPNQQQKDFVPWLVKNFGKRFYLIGSNYIYPKEENNVCKILLQQLGGEVVGEEYVPLGTFRVQLGDPEVQGHQAERHLLHRRRRFGRSRLHRQYKAAGLDPAKMPMASLTTSEEEIAAMGGEFAAGHFTSAPYFMSTDSPENHKFVEAYQKRYGAGKSTNFVSEPAYFQVHLFKKAVDKLAASDIDPVNIRKAAWGEEYQAPEGLVKIDPDSSHTYLWPKIGQAQPNGQFKIIEQSKEWVKPLPYWAYPGEVCTPTGMMQKKS